MGWYRTNGDYVTEYRVSITLESPDGTVETRLTKSVITAHGVYAAAVEAALQLNSGSAYSQHTVIGIQVVPV